MFQKWGLVIRRLAIVRYLGSTVALTVRRTPPNAKPPRRPLATRKWPSHGGRDIDFVGGGQKVKAAWAPS